MKDNDFCKRLRSIRERKGLTQSDLERLSEIPAMVVSQYETGARQPGLANLKALIRGLGCSADDLIGGGGQS